MFKFFAQKKFDFVLLASVLLLVLLGLLVLYSSSIKASSLTSEIDATRQILYAIAGLVLLMIFARSDYRILKDYSIALYFIMIGLLLAVEFFGKTTNGATRWITIGFFQFQPTEFAKLFLIIVLARYFAATYEHSNRLSVMVNSLLLLMPPMILVLVQPDLGSALVFGVIWLVMALATKVKKRYFLYSAAAVALAVPLIVPRLLPYQQERLHTLLNPTADPLGTGYNVTQSKIAVGSGGLFGRGLSAGSQSQLNFLPSQHTDFIFAVLAEKLGFVGAMLMLGLFVVMCLHIIRVSQKSRDRFGSFLAIGIVAMFLFHILINVGMNVGIMPVTGIPLPFLSAGGSAMLVSLIAIGIIESITSRSTGTRLNEDDML